MNRVYLLHYNNYFNRTLKIENDLLGYFGNHNENVVCVIEDMKNWNPQDGISTSIKTPNNTDFAIEPDYLLAVDDYGNIDSRWFVVENKRLHLGQYMCTLRRDLFADAWGDLINATCNIERAIVPHYNPLVFNEEPINVNQIINNERFIKDKTNCPWIVFYGNAKPDPVQFSLEHTYDYVTEDIDGFIEDNTFNYLSDDEADIQAVFYYQDNGTEAWSSPTARKTTLLPYGMSVSSPSAATAQLFNGTQGVVYVSNVPNIQNAFKTQYNLKGSTEALHTIAMNGKTVYDSATQKYYILTVRYTADITVSRFLTEEDSTVFANVKDIIGNYSNISYRPPEKTIDDLRPSNIWIRYDYRSTEITKREVTDIVQINAKVPDASYVPSDSPYFIWTMPFGEVTVVNTINGETEVVETDKEINLAVAMSFSRNNSSGKLYDFQILPYCPLPDEFIGETINDTTYIVVNENIHITDNTTLTKTVGGVTSVCGYIFSVPKASFSRQIILGDNERIGAIYNQFKKIDNITDRWRIYSPNYASSFEFSVAKNNGLRGYNIRCTYMPINPYIRVAPIWGGLYGDPQFVEDVKGLVCGGDYSMARIADAWINYQEQNKNFEAIFNRQIENMDIMRQYDRIEQGFGAVVGTMQGAAIGAQMGGFAGGVAGAAGGLMTGIADVAIAEGKYQENRSFATDIHGLQLGNIKAMPRTLARTTAFNVDNRYFPVLVLYQCTSEERKNVARFITERSMNVGIIDKPANYIENRWDLLIEGERFQDRGFIKGSIIKIETDFDTHFVNELNREFQLGVFMR